MLITTPSSSGSCTPNTFKQTEKPSSAAVNDYFFPSSFFSLWKMTFLTNTKMALGVRKRAQKSRSVPVSESILQRQR